MCGFAGLIAFDHRFAADEATLAAMSAAVAHRGPDDHAMRLDAPGEPGRPRVALAFRRLAILDLDPRANQPLATPDGRWTLVFNGEIYNFRDLRAELDREAGVAWRTRGDGEVLLHALARWGEDALPRLNGMFAFAAWDAARQRLMLGRDRMGQKPLYYAALDGDEGTAAVAFASELGALRPVAWLDDRLHRGALIEYLRWGSVPGELTILHGARKLRPGHVARIGRDGVDARRYFHPGARHAFDPPELRRLAPAARARALVERAVARQLVSDVPVACLLSGGVDSSIVALCMARASGDPTRVRTFSIGFDDPRYDESRHAREVAAFLGTQHHAFVVRPDAAADLPALARVFGEPFGDSSALPTHYLAREVRRHVKVALSGDGGDELFGGYDRYRALDAAERLRGLPWPVPGLAGAALWQRLPGRHPKALLTRLKRFAAAVRLPAAERYAAWMQVFSPAQVAELLADGAPVPADAAMVGGQWFDAFRDDRDLVAAALALDRCAYLPDDLLTKLDRASMLHALEVRSPFMDHELVMFASTLDRDALLRGGGKRLLREGFAPDLPPTVFARRKMGFAVPIGEWYRGALRGFLRDALLGRDARCGDLLRRDAIERLIVDHEQRRADHAHRLHALLMLELWARATR